MRNKLFVLASLLILASMVLGACATPTPETIIQTVEVEKITTVEVEKPGAPGETIIVTATPEPEMPVEFMAPDPKTFTLVSFGDVDTLDPAWNYESAGDAKLDNLYDTLVTYEGADASKMVPKLVTWEVQDEGATYVFTLRKNDIKFHEGQDLTAEDIAYTFQRGLLQGGGSSPQWLYTEAFFGTGIYDVACLMDDNECALEDAPEDLQAADPAKLLEVCETVTSKIVADEAAGTVTFYLSQPWAPLLATLGGSWGAVIDKGWSIEQGAWDGDCATWQNFYGVTSETSPLRAVANGTGPFKLDHWTPGEEFVMVANPDYWLDEPTFEGGPTGAPAFDRVVILSVDEWGTRFAMMQAGDADWVSVPIESRVQIDPMVGELCTFQDWGVYDCQPTETPDQPLRMYKGTPATSRTDAMFVFEVSAEGNPYIGSGALDGNGIPADFFTDINARKAFNYCFDHESFISEVYQGEAVQNIGPINQGMLGYNPDGPYYSFDPAQCQAEIEQAWGGAVAENGFRLQIGFNTGNTTRQTVAQILQANFQDIDPKYNIEVIGLPWPSFLAAIRESRLPLYISGWGEDIHDPHNWAQPFLVGTYAARQNLPDDMVAEFQELLNAGIAGTTDEARAEAYYQVGQLDYDYSIAIRLPVGTGRSYVQRWVSTFLINPAWYEPYYYFAKQ